MRFLDRRGGPPLTETMMQASLRAAHCTLIYHFDHVHVIDQLGSEYHICRIEQLATLDTHQFAMLLQEALSYRLKW